MRAPVYVYSPASALPTTYAGAPAPWRWVRTNWRPFVEAGAHIPVVREAHDVVCVPLWVFEYAQASTDPNDSVTPAIERAGRACALLGCATCEALYALGGAAAIDTAVP